MTVPKSFSRCRKGRGVLIRVVQGMLGRILLLPFCAITIAVLVDAVSILLLHVVLFHGLAASATHTVEQEGR